jgi:hypothetical protein
MAKVEEKTLDLARCLAQAVPSPIRSLNLDASFGIPYLPSEQPLDLTAVGVTASPTAFLGHPRPSEVIV